MEERTTDDGGAAYETARSVFPASGARTSSHLYRRHADGQQRTESRSQTATTEASCG